MLTVEYAKDPFYNDPDNITVFLTVKFVEIADELPAVNTDAINKKGNRTLKNFDLVNTGHSPTLDKQESAIAQLVTPKDHPER